jgi:serine/threonine-protein kinase HipA
MARTAALDVWMNGEHVGRWTRERRTRHAFAYSDKWCRSPKARPISLSMPLVGAEQSYRGDLVEAFFDNLLPESPLVRSRVQSQFGAPSSDPFDLLAEIGRDCVGAIQLVPEGAKPDDVNHIAADPLSESAVAEALRAVLLPAPLGQRRVEPFRISIAGAQEKTALLHHEGRWCRPLGATPTTHIFKLPLGRVGRDQLDLSTSVENEWLCSRLLAAYGMAAAWTEIDRFEDQRVLVVTRFDRERSRSGAYWVRIPQEDMCQALATPPAQKYEADGGPGVRRIMELLLGARNAQESQRRFFQAQVLFWMLAAIDGHAKNFSVFIEHGGSYSLTPLYDVLSAYPVMGQGAGRLPPQAVTMAMAVWGKQRHYRWSEIRLRHWLATARDCGLATEAPGVIQELIDRTPGAIAEVEATLPRDLPASVSEPILAGAASAARRLAAG